MTTDRGAASERVDQTARWPLRAVSVVLAVAGLAALSVLVATPRSGSVAHAADVDVASCDEAAFTAAVDAVQSSGGGTVRFDCSGTIPITRAITITTMVEVDGDGSVVLDAGGGSRFFVVQPTASLSLVGLELVNGRNNGDGGAILNLGTLSLVGSTLASNASSSNGGAISNAGHLAIHRSTLSSNRADSGGAIENEASGRVEIASSALRDNTATQLFMRGGAIVSNGELSVRSSEFVDNTTGQIGWGGAVYLSGDDGRPATADVATTTFTGNDASQGGAIALDNDSSIEMIDSELAANTARNGGAVTMAFSTTATVTSSRLAANTASNVGGAVHNFSDGQLTFVDSVISGNSAVADGGAITAGAVGAVTRLTRTTLVGNTAGRDGGAIWAGRARVTAIASTFANNRAERHGGAIHDHQDNGARAIRSTTFAGNSAAGNGGAIFNATNGLRISDSLFATNTADGPGGALYNVGRFGVTGSTFTENRSGADGGAIWTDNDLSTNSIGASTFVANAAVNGGALYTGWTELTDIVAATIVGNTATTRGGGIYTRTGGVASRASIVSHNVAPLAANCFREIRSFTQEDGSVRVEDWTIDTGGDNLSNDTTCQFDAATDIENSVAFPVAGLSQNGGPTPTMLPLAAALDTADCTSTTAVDQRGAERPSTACDRGAVEASSDVPVRLLDLVPDRTAIDEGGSISLIVVASGPAGHTLDYEFDCDGDGTFERQGVRAGTTASGSCTFGDDGSFTVQARVCLRADATRCDTGSFAVEVANVAPTIVRVGNDGPVPQGGRVNIVVDAEDPAGPNDPLVVSADCDGDGSFETIGSTTVVQCEYALQGTFDVPVQVDDGDGGTDESTTTVDVRNDVPLITAVTATQPLAEGQSATIEVEASDAGGALSYEFDCDGDGAYEVGPQPDSSTECAFGDDGAYSVLVRVTDADGAAAGSSTQVVVDNVAPVITGVFGEPVDEGDPASFEVSMTGEDAAGDADILRYEFDCDNDGRYELGPLLAESATCSFDDDGQFTIGLRITDGDGGSATGTATALVRNLDPIISEIRVADTVDEGAPLSVEVVATDPAGLDDPLAFEFDCAGDGDFEIGPQASPTATCVFPDVNDPDVTVRVTDDDGGAAQQNALVFVDNVDPVVDTPTVAPTPSSEGESVTAVAAFTDAGIEDSHTCTVDYGDGSGAQTGVVDGSTCTGPPHVYVDDGVGFIVIVEVADDDFGFGSNSVSHDVGNAPPSIESLTGPDGAVVIDQTVTVAARVLDPGENDVVTATWEWGDGTTTPAEIITARSAAGFARSRADLTVEHRYAAAGDYTVTLLVEDDDGGSSSETLTIVVRAAPPPTTTPPPATPPTTTVAVPSPAPVVTPTPTAAPTTAAVRPLDVRLPATGGSEAQPIVAFAVLLVALGTTLLIARRRSRSALR